MIEKTAQYKKNFFICLPIFLLCFILDRVSKIYVINFFISNNYNDQYINSFINIVLIWNKGIAFGLLQSENIFYHLISFIILFIIIFLFYVVMKSKNLIELSCFSILIGGALGNFYDRIFYGSVPDFIDLHYKNFHWFTFNIADIFITLAIMAILFFDIFKFRIKA